MRRTNIDCKEVFLSVIVPIYNIESYITCCLDSLVESLTIFNASWKENDVSNLVEIILVDDGSTDNSGKICDYYENRIKNIYVIHKDNGGLVKARVTGVEYSKGEYLTFVDGDDFVENNYLDTIVKNLKKNEKCDILLENYIEDNGKDKTIRECGLEDGIYSGRDIISRFMTWENMRVKTSPSVWSKVFKKRIFEECMKIIPPIRDGEDTLFTLACMQSANIVIVCNDISAYHYRINNSSMSHGFDKRYVDNVRSFCRGLDLIFGDNKDFVDNITYTKAYMLYRYLGRLLDRKIIFDYSERKKMIKELFLNTDSGRAFCSIPLKQLDIPILEKIIIRMLMSVIKKK